MFNENLRVLALSSSRTEHSTYLEPAFPAIKDLLGTQQLQIAFIPFAMANGNYEQYAKNVQEGLASLPHRITCVTHEDPKRIIEEADAIMVGGGNSFKLLHDLHNHGLVELIQQKINQGTPYIGWSAGSNMLSPGIFTTNDMPIVQPKNFTALNVLPFQINPHYNNELPPGHRGETRDQRLEEFLILNPGKQVVGLAEGTGLLIMNGKITITGGANAIHFFEENKKIVKEEMDSAGLNKIFNS